jgi:hypothetical protein
MTQPTYPKFHAWVPRFVLELDHLWTLGYAAEMTTHSYLCTDDSYHDVPVGISFESPALWWYVTLQDDGKLHECWWIPESGGSARMYGRTMPRKADYISMSVRHLISLTA